jgi:hypothetical protein
MTSSNPYPRVGIQLAEVLRGNWEPRQASSEWRLPSGQDLISFALASGLAARPIMADLGGVDGTRRARPLLPRAGARRK